MLYLQTFTVKFSERMSFSLSTATISPPIIYFRYYLVYAGFGISAIVDGLHNRKQADRVVFNIAQFMLSGLAGSLVFKFLAGGPAGILGRRDCGYGLRFVLLYYCQLCLSCAGGIHL